jgi:hypothetical protein
MSIFYGGEVTVPSNAATKLVDSAAVDRQVHLVYPPQFLGFTSGEVTGRTSSYPAPLEDLVLPAGKELWGYGSSATYVQILVTAIGR